MRLARAARSSVPERTGRTALGDVQHALARERGYENW
jgi:hypothetical protein